MMGRRLPPGCGSASRAVAAPCDRRRRLAGRARRRGRRSRSRAGILLAIVVVGFDRRRPPRRPARAAVALTGTAELRARARALRRLPVALALLRGRPASAAPCPRRSSRFVVWSSSAFVGTALRCAVPRLAARLPRMSTSEPRRMALRGCTTSPRSAPTSSAPPPSTATCSGLALVQEGANDDDPGARHFWFGDGEAAGAPGRSMSFIEYPEMDGGAVGAARRTTSRSRSSPPRSSRPGATTCARAACRAPSLRARRASARSTCATPTGTCSRSHT